jgi:two-component system, OmpR family, response regulator TctD
MGVFSFEKIHYPIIGCLPVDWLSVFTRENAGWLVVAYLCLKPYRPCWHMKLLLIEDDEAMRTTLARTLARRGWLVETCADGARAVGQWQRVQPDAVVLDLSLPGLDGLEVLTRARAAALMQPVLILTARGTVGDRILGLNSGADDYLPKPFDLDELEARLRALVRARSRPTPEDLQDKQTISAHQMGALRYEKESGAFYVRDAVLELSPREAALLSALMDRAGQAVTKEKLLERVFAQDADVQLDAVEVVAYRLRKKLADAQAGVQLVTLRGLGYLLKEASSA